MKSCNGSSILFLCLICLIVAHALGEECIFDDRFEDNDIKTQATQLSLPADEGLLISNYNDHDFYSFDICSGGRLTIDCLFTHADGDIDISLERADGTQLAIANSSTDNERIVYDAPANEELFLLVRMYSFNQCNGYQLQISLDCPPNEEICWDGIDNDGDGDADCNDYGCTHMPPDFFGVISPSDGEVVSGQVVIYGSADDNGKMCETGCFYTLAYCNQYASCIHIEPSIINYNEPVIKDVMGVWDTIGMGVPDGEYYIEFDYSGACVVRIQHIPVIVDNTLPTAEISTPAGCESRTGIVSIYGTAFDENLESWVLDYVNEAGSYWTPIATGTQPVVNGLLAQWDTSSLQSCSTTVRLRVYDKRPGSGPAEYLVPFKIGLSADITNDKNVTMEDLAQLAQQFLESW